MAVILLNSTLASGSSGLFDVLQAGGGSGKNIAPGNGRETNNDATWYSMDQHHRFELYTDAELNHLNNHRSIIASVPSATTRWPRWRRAAERVHA